MAPDASAARQLSFEGRAPAPSETRADSHQRAMTRAGRWLALRPRTVTEMRTRLSEGGFDPETVEGAIARLVELRLLDDLAYAEQYVEERARKGLGPHALRAELETKGVDAETAGAAVAGVEDDETRIATEVAVKALKRLADRPLEQQAARLRQALARKGFSEEAAREAVRAVLPPEGWD